MGASLDARTAGYKPKTHASTKAVIQAIVSPQGFTTNPYGKTGDRARQTAPPATVPTNAPSAASTTASIKNCTSTSPSEAPIALRSPISKRRSENEISITDSTPTPPTNSTTPARLKRTTV